MEREIINETGGKFARHWASMALLSIVVLGGGLRLAKFGESPPGLNQDEAVNAWNAQCLLKTGKDQVGVSWPIFYMRGIGGNWSPLYIYLSIPFQAIGGLSITTTRAPAVFFGIVSIAVIYYAGKRLFNEKAGLLAALLLALSPWHFQQSRWGHESSIAALLGLTPLALMLWSNIIPINNKAPRLLAAGVTGVVTGICCYGYQPVRVFICVFLFLIFLLNLRRFAQELKKPKYLAAVIVFIIGFGVIFGPLAWQYIFHPEGVNRGFLFQPKRFGTVGLYESVRNTLIRYVEHYGPGFLCKPVDYISPPNKGLIEFYLLPMLAAGFITVIIRFRKSMQARIVLAFMLAYPMGDILIWDEALSTMRSFAGSGGFILLAALGGVSVLEWFWRRYKAATAAAAGILAVIITISSVSYFTSFYTDCNRSNENYDQKFYSNIVEAFQWLKPRYDEYDAVLFSYFGVTELVAMVTMEYEPKRWFSEPIEYDSYGEWDYYTRVGKMYFYPDNIPAGCRPGHILLIIRPGEITLPEIEQQVIHKIYRPDGTEALWLCII